MVMNTGYQVALQGLFFFELKGLLGRMFMGSKPRIRQDESKNLLHLGCGKTMLEGWVNADYYSFRLKNRPDWMLDLRDNLDCNDDVWDGVFSEHTLEHLYPPQAKSLLEELFRTMKPKAWLRLTVPDLKKYIDFYCGAPVDDQFERWSTGCEAMRSLSQDFFHLSLWDEELLSKVLSDIGFINISRVGFMEGSDQSLLQDSKDRQWETLYIEAQKPAQLS